MDFPGTVSVDVHTLIAYLTDVATSVARHGFAHVLIVNSHGSNAPIADLAARRVVLETGETQRADPSCGLVDSDVLARSQPVTW